MSDYLGRHSGNTIDTAIQKVVDSFLPFVGDAASTRLQVKREDRTTGLMISYLKEGELVIEYYVKGTFTDEAWKDEASWQKGSQDKVVKEVGKELIPTILLQKLTSLATIKTIGANLSLSPEGVLSATFGGTNDYNSLSNKPSIGGIELSGNKSLATLGIQPAGAYITQTSLTNTLTSYLTKTEAANFYVAKEEGKRLITEEEADNIAGAITRTALEEELLKKVDVVPGEGLITDSERASIANAIDSNTLSTELAKKVDKVEGGRLITGAEATRLASAVTSNDLEPYSLKDTGVLEEAVEVPKEEKQYIKFFDEVNGIERKISIQNFILGVSTVYPTARTLIGEKNGINETFTSEYNYIAGSEKLNINGSIYYPNTGFYKEEGKIILSGAPIPEAGDFMFLEAIYLD